MILALVKDAVHAGAGKEEACKVAGICERTFRRWNRLDGGEDRRKGPLSPPANKLTDKEVEKILHMANLPHFRDLSPHQIVPALADMGVYCGSESTIYRILRREGLNAHRLPTRPATPSVPTWVRQTGLED